MDKVRGMCTQTLTYTCVPACVHHMYEHFSFQHSKSLGVHGKVALRKIYRYIYAPIHLGSSVRPMLSMDRAPTKTPLSMTSQHQPLHQLTFSTYQRCLGLQKEPTLEDSMLRHDSYCLVKGAKGTLVQILKSKNNGLLLHQQMSIPSVRHKNR